MPGLDIALICVWRRGFQAEDQPLTRAAPGFLGNDSDADGDVLTANLLAAGGGQTQIPREFSRSNAPNRRARIAFACTRTVGLLA